MKIAVFSLSKEGLALAKQISSKFKADSFYLDITEDNNDYLNKAFKSYAAIIFVMSTDNAVKLMAAPVSINQNLPSVLVVDEKGKYTVSLINGKESTADSLAKDISGFIKSSAIITTVAKTEIMPLEMFAIKNGCHIENPNEMKHISIQLLEGKKIPLFTHHNVTDVLHNLKVIPLDELGDELRFIDIDSCILFSNSLKKYKYSFKSRLVIRPRNIVIGTSFKKNVGVEIFEQVLLNFLDVNKISSYSLFAIATTDSRRYEKALLSFSEKYKIIIKSLSPSAIAKFENEYLVEDKPPIGTDNTAEICAGFAFFKTQLICKKTTHMGITIAMGELMEEYALRL